MAGQNHSQHHLWSKIIPDGTSIRCLGQTHEVEYVSIDLGVFVVWRITEIMLNIKPCSLDDKHPTMQCIPMHRKEDTAGHVQIIPAADFHCIFRKSLIYF